MAEWTTDQERAFEQWLQKAPPAPTQILVVKYETLAPWSGDDGLFQCPHVVAFAPESKEPGEVVLCQDCAEVLEANEDAGIGVEYVDAETGKVVRK